MDQVKATGRGNRGTSGSRKTKPATAKTTETTTNRDVVNPLERLESVDEHRYVSELIARIVREAPRRQPTSEDERKGHEIMISEFADIKLPTRQHYFKFNDSLYKNLLLHFGLGTLGTAVSGVAPLAGLILHGVAGGSYWADSLRKGYYLRRLLGFKESRNVLATIPAKNGNPDLRIVIIAHIDAAFTGLMFQPDVVTMISGEPPKPLKFLKRGLEVATRTQHALTGFDLLRVFLGPLTWPLRPIEWALTAPALITMAINLDVVLRNQIVPGANDDLSGVAALPILARRLAGEKPDNVEYVFGVTGCEEASLGGGDALARDMDGEWDKTKTVVLALDSLSLGTLTYLRGEGEVNRIYAPQWLQDACVEVAASEPRFTEVYGYDVPVGGSDVAAFLNRGWDGICLTCVDPVLGTPLHYHQMSDSPENLDVDKVLFSIDFAEKLIRRIEEIRLS